jgi:molybdenum cofactor synthesis domain-containing protein
VESPRTAAALVIGSELLSGKVAETNVLLLARTLRSMGIVLDRVVIVLDEREVIAQEVRQLSSSHDVVFTSGGMGPTHDDVTVQAVADAFGVGTVVPELTRGLLEEHFGDTITEGHLQMAKVPEGARLVRAPKAPWPTVVMRNVWLLPGVPQIFARKMALVRAELGSDRPFVSRSLRTNLDECSIKPHLDRVVADHPEVAIGSYPQWRTEGYCTEVTFDGAEEAPVRRAHDALAEALPAGSIEPEEE